MGLGFKRTLGVGSIPVFQGTGKDISLAQGGFGLDITGLIAASILPAGTPMIFDEATRLAKPLVTAKVYEAAGAADVVYKVAKGSQVKVGDYLASVQGGKAYAITVVDTSNASYDSLTVGTTIGVALLDSTLFISSATGASAAAHATVSGLLYSDTKVEAGESVSVVIRGTVYARRVPYTTDIAADLPHIIFSQSF